jgi:hypothetical protein
MSLRGGSRRPAFAVYSSQQRRGLASSEKRSFAWSGSMTEDLPGWGLIKKRFIVASFIQFTD